MPSSSVTAAGVVVTATAAFVLWRRRRALDGVSYGQDRNLSRLPADCSAGEVCAALRRDGAVIVERLVTPETMASLSDDVAALEATEYSGTPSSFAGSKTRRCGPYLLAHSAAARTAAAHPLAVSAAEGVLGGVCRRIRLSVVASIRVLSGQPAQVLHRDDDEWPLALIGGITPGLEIEVSALWAVSDFTAANGATNVVVGSQGSHDPADPPPPRERRQFAEMTTGSVLFFTGSVWHGAGAASEVSGNDRGRQGLLVQYIAGWLHPEYNLHFAVDPHRSSGFDCPRLRALMGFDGPALFNAQFPGPVYATEYTGYPDRTDADFSK